MELAFRDTCSCPSAKQAGCYQQLFNWAHKIVGARKNSRSLAGNYLRTGSWAQMEKVRNHNCRPEIEKLDISVSVLVNINGDFD
jgi:hypothetical protein